MQSLSLTLSKRLSNSNPLFRISSNLVAYASSTTTASSSPPNSSPSPISAANGTSNNFLTAPWSANQSRGIPGFGSDVRVGNLIENRGRAYEVLKQYHSLGGKATIEVPSQTVAGYATVATTGGVDRRKEGNTGPKTKREQLLKATALVPLLLLYPNAYSLLAANLFVFWHIRAGIEEILADYVHQEMTREFVMISFKLFLIIAMKDIFLKFVFV
ncbi:PREDICTED: uncharacterized protein LOC109341172 isoform X2 [Lupinus angustifolius]|uniref:uncharacterized protein LOC109341172 isoform X2 n=1 Tax=Lupinus angustifolius TaxID=3871 RepID=UPI00092F068F|nr:PREDICTED: uncharacterized protein LOC109341172 isoform X2 [Lupinus angustifolius]